MRGPHLQADHEQEHHHAELGGMQDGLRIGEPPEPERADGQAGGEIAQHRAEPKPAEQRHHDHCRAQQSDDFHQFTGTCFHRHAVASPDYTRWVNDRAKRGRAIARMMRLIVLNSERYRTWMPDRPEIATEPSGRATPCVAALSWRPLANGIHAGRGSTWTLANRSHAWRGSTRPLRRCRRRRNRCTRGTRARARTTGNPGRAAAASRGSACPARQR